MLPNYKRMLIQGEFEPTPPGEEIQHLFFNYRGRYFVLSEIPRTPGWCKWCRTQRSKSMRSHYCSLECDVSAEIFCYPQRYCARIYLEKKQKNRCAYCRCGFDGYDGREVDHIIPIYKGGEAIGFGNTQLLCKSCHMHKTKQDMMKMEISLDEKTRANSGRDNFIEA